MEKLQQGSNQNFLSEEVRMLIVSCVPFFHRQYFEGKYGNLGISPIIA